MFTVEDNKIENVFDVETASEYNTILGIYKEKRKDCRRVCRGCATADALTRSSLEDARLGP